MAKPKKVTTTTVEESVEERKGESIEAQTSLSVEDIATQNLVEQIEALGSTAARCCIYRADAHRGAMKFVGSVSPEFVSEEFIQSEYGEGRYSVRLLDARAHYIMSRIVDVAARKSDQSTAAAAALPQPIVSGSDPVMMARLESMIQEQATNREMMLRLIDKIGSAHDGGQQSTLSEFASVVTTLTAIMPKSNTPIDSVKEMVGIFREGMKIGASGAAGGDKSWMETIKDVLGSLPELIAGAKSMAASNVLVPIEDANSQTDMKQISSTQKTSLEGLRQGINYLKIKAAQGKDPRLWIDVIVDNLDDPQWASLAGQLTQSYEEIGKLDAELLTPVYRPWFERLFEGIRNALHERIQYGDGEGGDVADASSDAPVGA